MNFRNHTFMPMFWEYGSLHACFPSYLVKYSSKFRNLCFQLARGTKPPRIPPTSSDHIYYIYLWLHWLWNKALKNNFALVFCNNLFYTVLSKIKKSAGYRALWHKDYLIGKLNSKLSVICCKWNYYKSRKQLVNKHAITRIYSQI